MIEGYDFVNSDGDPMDDNGHGTHVAGIVAANGGVKGVAPDADLLAFKVCDSFGYCLNSWVIQALEMASNPDGNPLTDDFAHVINVSLSGSGNPDDPMSQAVDNTVDIGIVVVVASGNYGPGFESLGSPGVARKALTVAASDKNDQLASFSSRGPVREIPGFLKPDITAPGVSIRSTWINPDRYMELDGTSMATPHMTGGVALIKQLHPTWSPDMIKANLMNTAKDLGIGVYEQGAGRVQLNQAATVPFVATPGSVSFGVPLPGTLTSMQLIVTNISNQAITFDASISASQWADKFMTPNTPPIPIDYAYLSSFDSTISPGETSIVTINLDIPNDASEGYYTGSVLMQSGVYAIGVPFTFTLLSKISIHILDETGEEWIGSSFNSAILLTRIPDLYVSRLDVKSPTTFFIPSGNYNIHGIGKKHLYAPWPQPTEGQYQRPLILSKNITVQANSVVEVYLDAGQAHLFNLNTTTYSGNPISVTQWGTGFRYQSNGNEYQFISALWGGCSKRLLRFNTPKLGILYF